MLSAVTFHQQMKQKTNKQHNRERSESNYVECICVKKTGIIGKKLILVQGRICLVQREKYDAVETAGEFCLVTPFLFT